MTTIQGSIAKLVDNSSAMFESLGYISSNIANYNTNCYKAQRFETFMNPGGTVQGVVRTDFAPGDLMKTSRELDVGVQGTGFIPVTGKKGETAYIRGGSFAVDSEGYLVTSSGWMVGGGIKLPATYKRVKIDTDGTVLVLKSKDASFNEVGKIPLVAFKNPEGLEIAEGNMVKPTEKSGEPELLLGHSKIKQGKIEKANVDPFAFINETLKINGSILSSSRFIKIMDQMYRESTNLR